VDLRAEAQRLTLDVVAVECCAALARAGVPHVVLKGPSTSLWLYDPPRPYRDVDLLVPLSQVDRAVSVLGGSGLAEPAAGRLGEEAPHSLLLRSSRGSEIDLHVTLPTVPIDGDRPWEVLRDHVEQLDLGVGSVPVLDEPGRCLVIALHALNNGPGSGQPMEDLERARSRCGEGDWAVARAIARSLIADDLLSGALAMTDGALTVPERARLYLMQAPSAAFGLDRLLHARTRDIPRMLWRELLPSRGFMAYHDPELGGSLVGLAHAHVRRWRRIVSELPGAIRAVRRR
jgi:hypothetical protein